jgi:four helix bundle protein
MPEIKSYRDLEVWRMGMDLAEQVYRLTRLFPKEEQYRVSAQLIGAATSVPANIAEGHMRSTRKDYSNFVSIARGSLAEVETYLVLAQRLALAPEEEIGASLELAEGLGRRLTRLKGRLAVPRSGA